jgi:predicted metal-dependent hydrolase
VRSDKESLMRSLRRDARRIAARFGLSYRTLEAENARVKRRYGSYDTEGVVRIRLTHVRTGRPLKYSSMIDTLCHELAHTKYFHHGLRFQALYERILAWARQEGIYRPTPRGERPRAAVSRPAPIVEVRPPEPHPEPRQLALF